MGKAQAGLTAIAIILIAIIFIGWLVKIGSRECSSNNDCEKGQYCGSDFSCHNIPIIEKSVTKVSITGPTVVICVTIIVLAIILRWEKIFHRERTGRVKRDIEMEEPYYTSQFKYTAK